MTTAQPPDPDPFQTPDLEPGGGVESGATPPESAQTSGLSAPQASARRQYTPTQVAALIALTLFVIVFLTTAVLLILDAFGVFD